MHVLMQRCTREAQEVNHVRGSCGARESPTVIAMLWWDTAGQVVLKRKSLIRALKMVYWLMKEEVVQTIPVYLYYANYAIYKVQ